MGPSVMHRTSPARKCIEKYKVVTSFHNIPDTVSPLPICHPVGVWLSVVRRHIRPPKKAKAELLKTYLEA